MNNFFDSQNNKEKVTEKVFGRGLIISVVSIFICIVALCSATYAWFVGGVSSNTNTLTSGSFDITVSVSREDAGGEILSYNVDKDAGTGRWSCELPADGTAVTYTVTLKLTDQSTVKGHCIIRIGDGEPLHTAPIIGTSTSGADALSSDEMTDPFVLTITVSETTTVTFESRWGIVVHSDISYGDDVDMTTEEETTEEETTEEETTEEETTEEETTEEETTEEETTEEETTEEETTEEITDEA